MIKMKDKKSIETTARKPTGKAVKKFTLDDMMAGFDRIQRLHEETEKTLNKAIAETKKTIDKAVAETEKTLYKAIKGNEKTLNKTIGGLGHTIGNLAESLLVPNLTEKFKKLGFTFEIINPHRKIRSEQYNIYAEIDAFLENGSQAMAVEVKTTLDRDDVNDHIKRMEKIRRFADLHNDKRQFFGSMAAAVLDEDTRRYALKQGFYIVELAGEDVKIIKPVSAKAW